MIKININNVKNFLKEQGKKRPILGCINYTRDNINYTNSYSLVRINTSNKNIIGEFNLNVFDGLLNGGSYPNLDMILSFKDMINVKSYKDKKIIKDEVTKKDITYIIFNNGENDLYFIEDELNKVSKTLIINDKQIKDIDGLLSIENIEILIPNNNHPRLIIKNDCFTLMSLGVKSQCYTL